MKLSLALLAGALADVCQDCDDNISDFNAWVNNDRVVCSRYTDPREMYASARAACKDCKIQCVPTEEACPGVEALEAGFWNRTGKKLTTQYIERAKEMAEARELQRRKNQFAKEQEKLNKIKQKTAEKKAKAENKAHKKADFEEWREEKRQENEAKRAQKKQEKKDRKAAAKALKELRKEQREQKRALAEQNKVLFAFYADLEEHYVTVCPDMFLIKDNELARSYAKFKQNNSD